MIRTLIWIATAYFIGWKQGQTEASIPESEACKIDVAGEIKTVPKSVCSVISKAKSYMSNNSPFA